MKKAAGGLFGYGLAAFVCPFPEPQLISALTIDGGEETSCSVLGLAIGNGDLTAGGMSLTPGAEPDDGVLNLLTIHGQSLAETGSGVFRKSIPASTSAHRGSAYRPVKRCRLQGPMLARCCGGRGDDRPPSVHNSVLERAILVTASSQSRRQDLCLRCPSFC